MELRRRFKKAFLWILELVLLAIAERELNPAIDLVNGQVLTGTQLFVSVAGLLAIIGATILGVILGERGYKWLREASHAYQISKGYVPIKATFENKIFSNQDVDLEGKSFKNCDFSNCRILVSKGHYNFQNNRIASDCRLVLNYEAIQIVETVRIWHPELPVYKPGVEDRGKPESQT